MDADSFSDFEFEKIPSALKSEEELGCLSTPENISETEKSLLLLRNGMEIQKCSAIGNFPHLVESDPEGFSSKVVPLVKELMPGFDPMLQTTLCQVCVGIATSDPPLLSSSGYSEVLLPIFLVGLSGEENSHLWLNGLVEMGTSLTEEAILSKVVPIITANAHISRSVPTRVQSCRLLHPCLMKTRNTTIFDQLLRLLKDLCQDIEYDVRAASCHQLGKVAHALSNQRINQMIFPELTELLKDDSVVVKSAAIETLAEILPLLDSDLKTLCIPTISKIFSEAHERLEATLQIAVTRFPQFLENIKDSVTPAQMKEFADHFVQFAFFGAKDQDFSSSKISKSLTNSCREGVAENIGKVACIVGKKIFKENIFSTFKALLEESDCTIRRTAVKSLCQVAETLGDDSLRPLFVELCKSADLETTREIVPNLARITALLLKPQKADLTHEFAKIFQNFEAALTQSYCWHSHVTFVEQFLQCLHLFPQNVVHQKFVPSIWKHLKSPLPLPLINSYIVLILTVIRHTKSRQKRQDYINKIITDFCASPSCYSRICFINIVTNSFRIFSRQFNKTHFVPHLIELISDPIVIVRFSICHCIMDCRRCIKPEDVDLLAKLKLSLRAALSGETDSETALAWKK